MSLRKPPRLKKKSGARAAGYQCLDGDCSNLCAGSADFPDIWRAFFIGAAKGAVLDCHRSNRPASNPDSVRSARNGRPSHRWMLYVDAPARGIPDTALSGWGPTLTLERA